jgi:hypothetical protein
MADPLASATELALLTGSTEQADLSREQFLLEMASGMIRSYCHQTLSLVVDDVVTVYPTASTLLTLPERPVTAVSSVLVNGVATTSFYVNPRGIRSSTVASSGSAWTSGATVTYSHGYLETSEEYRAIKSVCLAAASRAFTMNRDGASNALGNTVMEAAGYGPEIFLTPGEKETLKRFKRGPVR